MKFLFGSKKGKRMCLLALIVISQCAVSCGTKDSGSMALESTAGQEKAVETESWTGDEVIEIKEDDWSKEGTDIWEVAGCTEVKFAGGDWEQSVTRDVSFVNRGPEGMDTVWTSDDESVISNEGKVTRQKEDKTVTITANVSYHAKKYRKDFTITVKRKNTIDINSLEDYSKDRLDEMNRGDDKYEVEMNDSGCADTIFGTYSNVKVDSWDTALVSLYNVRSLLGIGDIFEELEPESGGEFDGIEEYNFKQVYKGVEVRDSSVTVGLYTNEDGRPHFVDSGYSPVPENLDTNPRITKEEAAEIAEKAGYGKFYPSRGERNRKLYIINNNGKTRLVWDLYCSKDPKDILETYEVVIDAQTGEVVCGKPTVEYEYENE